MSDIISRKLAIELLENTIAMTKKEERRRNYCVELIKAMPSVEPVRKWIPCSERLPEEGEVVLTQAKFKDDGKMAISARVDFNYWTGWGTREIDIVAWMPLPKPYEGDKE